MPTRLIGLIVGGRECPRDTRHRDAGPRMRMRPRGEEHTSGGVLHLKCQALAQGSRACGQRGARHRHRRDAIESSFFDALLGTSRCGRSIQGMKAHEVHRHRRGSSALGVRQGKKKHIDAHNGGTWCRRGQTLVCIPNNTCHHSDRHRRTNLISNWPRAYGLVA